MLSQRRKCPATPDGGEAVVLQSSKRRAVEASGAGSPGAAVWEESAQRPLLESGATPPLADRWVLGDQRDAEDGCRNGDERDEGRAWLDERDEGRAWLGGFVRRIHDEDGACVDVVLTRHYGLAPDGGPRAVAVKTYDLEQSLPWLVDEEVALLSRLQGRSHTVALLESFQDAHGNRCLVFPFVGDDVTPQTPSDVRAYLRQLLEALEFLHERHGVMHRNVKRANILWSASTRQLHLIDFEGSCVAHHQAVYSRFGNNLYRAPELAAAKRGPGELAPVYLYNTFDCRLTPAASVTCKADIWSAGVVFAELLIGCRRLMDVDALPESYEALRLSLDALKAHEGVDPRTAFAEHMRGAAPGAEERLTRDAADLLARMLAWAPEERLHASDALLHPYFLRAVDDAEDAAFADAQARGAHGKRRRHRERRSIGQADGPTSTP